MSMKKSIMLDPGHAGLYYNQSPVVPGYYESAMTWKLSQKLKAALEAYGFKVGLTRYGIFDDPELTARGMAAKGYDLFLSLHSNASSGEKPDAPWIIHFAEDGKMYTDEVSEAVARVLGPVISEVMGVSDPYYYTKSCDFDRNRNGAIDDEWYGVLFGAKEVGVPGVILEHSFHTNKAAAEWLSVDENLDKLAEAEAEALARYYGMEENKPMTKEEKQAFEAYKNRTQAIEKKVAKLSRRYDTVEDCPSYGRATVKRLVDAGVLKGRTGGKLDLSEDSIRLLVYLNRAGAFKV